MRIVSRGLDRLRQFPGRNGRPIVSIVVVVYDMTEQAERTVVSLCPDYQQYVDANDYEVIVVENESGRLMRPAFLQGLPDNVRYFLRNEARPSPIPAIEFGVSKALGRNICVMIDGARMVTPGVVRNVLLAHRLFEQAVVSIPGYHLGEQLQQRAVLDGYDQRQEEELVRSIGWPEDGYRLFEIACFSGSCAGGFFKPCSESNCLSMTRALWDELGGYDPVFDLPGGGLANLDLYKRALEHPGADPVLVPGEGTFHQFHGGITTGGQDNEARDAYITASKEQYREIRGEHYTSPRRSPTLLGQFPWEAIRFMHFSAARALPAEAH